LEQNLVVQVPVREQLVVWHGALFDIHANVFVFYLRTELKHKLFNVVFNARSDFRNSLEIQANALLLNLAN
jgi:hypothetical protein